GSRSGISAVWTSTATGIRNHERPTSAVPTSHAWLRPALWPRSRERAAALWNRPGMHANVPGSIRVARIFGIDINVHFSWIVIFFFLVTNLSESFYPDQFPQWSRQKTFVVSAVSALLFFASVVAHELA